MELPKTFLAFNSLAFGIWKVKGSSWPAVTNISSSYSLKRATLRAGKVLESSSEHRFQRRTVIFSIYRESKTQL